MDKIPVGSPDGRDPRDLRKQKQSDASQGGRESEYWHTRAHSALVDLDLQGQTHFRTRISSAKEILSRENDHLEAEKEKTSTQDMVRKYVKEIDIVEESFGIISNWGNQLLRKRFEDRWNRLRPATAQKIAETLEAVQKERENTASSSQGGLSTSHDTRINPSSSQPDQSNRTKRPASPSPLEAQDDGQSVSERSSMRSVRRRFDKTHIAEGSIAESGIAEGSIAESTDQRSSLTKEGREHLKTEVEALQSDIQENINAFSSLPEAGRSESLQQISGNREALAGKIQMLQSNNHKVDTRLADAIKQLENVSHKREALQNEFDGKSTSYLSDISSELYERTFESYNHEEQSAKKRVKDLIDHLGAPINLDSPTYLADLKSLAKSHKKYMSQLGARSLTLGAQIAGLSQLTQEDTASSSQADVLSSSGGAPVREQMEQPPRASRTEKQLRDEVNAFVQALEANPKQKLGDILIVQGWREPGNELTQKNIDDLKKITVDLRESGQLDGRVAGKNGSKLCTTIQDAAKWSNTEIKAKKAEVLAAHRAKPEYKEKKAEYDALQHEKPEYKAKEAARRAKPEHKEKRAEYEALQSARKADEEAAQLETPLSFGPLAIGNLEENARRVKEEEQVLSFSDPEEQS